MACDILNDALLEVSELLGKAGDLREKGFRLVQIQCTRLDEKAFGSRNLELLYIFEHDGQLESMRLRLEQGEEIPSISSVFPAAFLYENEIHDLFGVPVQKMSIDYQGGFYQTAVPTPFNPATKDTGGN